MIASISGSDNSKDEEEKVEAINPLPEQLF